MSTSVLARATPLDAPDGSALQSMRGRTYVATLSGTLTMDYSYPNQLRLDPGGSGRDVKLPAGINGLWYKIVNFADNAETLTIKDSGGSTIETCDQNEEIEVEYDGTAWFVVAIRTIAIT